MSKLNYCKIHEIANDEEKLINFLQEKDLIPSKNICKCGKEMQLRKLGDGYFWRCWSTSVINFRKVKFNEKITLSKGSWFSQSKLDYGTILKITYGLIKNYSHNDVSDEADVDRKTVNRWAAYIRQVLVEWSIAKTEMIGGDGKVVEIDESKFGKRKYNKGHRVEGQWVFGGIERETGKSFLIPVEKRDAKTLVGIIKDWIRPGTTIISDCWKAYDCLNDEGFKHLTVNHSVNFVDPESGAHTNTVEGMWRHAKAFLPEYNRRKKNYAAYLAHFSFVKKAKSEGQDLFNYFLGEVAKIEFDLDENDDGLLQDDNDLDCMDVS